MNKKISAPFLLLVSALLFAIVFVFTKSFFAPEPEEQRKITTQQKAATPGGTATLTLDPLSATVYQGNPMPVTIKVYAPNSPEGNGIIGIKAKFTYDNNDALSLDSGNITNSLPSPWSYQHKTVTDNGNGTTTVNIEAIYTAAGTQGYIGAESSPQNFAVLNFTALNNGELSTSSTFTFDVSATGSMIRSKTDNLDILSDSLNSGSYTVYVDTTAPDTTITSAPSGTINTNSATFEWTGSDSPASPIGTPANELEYSYKLDSASWSAYSTDTQVTLTNISEGAHTFSVQARDKVNNIDPSPATANFTVDLETVINLKFMLNGLDAATVYSPKDVSVTLASGGYTYGPATHTANYNASAGYYETAVSIFDNEFPSGTASFAVKIKGPSHLRKSFSGNLTSNTENDFQRTSLNERLIPGDVNDDNKIALSDVTAILSAWTQSEVATTVGTKIYDINDDNIISITDVTGIISFWSASEVSGDL